MIRIVILIVCAVFVVTIGVVVWNVWSAPKSTEPVEAEAPQRQHYDLEGGQEMRPRWGKSEGGADAADRN